MSDTMSYLAIAVAGAVIVLDLLRSQRRSESPMGAGYRHLPDSRAGVLADRRHAPSSLSLLLHKPK